MAFLRQYIHRLAKSFQPRDTPDDEERLIKEEDGQQQTPSTTGRRWPAPGKVTLWLLFMDLIIFVALLWILNPLITLLNRNQELFPADLKFDPAAKAHKNWDAASPNAIPRILHQTSANSTIPAKWVESQASCLKTYPDWEYKLWTDESFREFLVAEYPWFVDSWDNYPFPIQRADSLRYFVLYHYGGMYLDMDTFCNKTIPIHQFDPSVPIAIFQSTLPTGVTNDFMMASARHPAYERLITQLPVYFKRTHWWGHLQPYCNIMIAAGPMFVTLVLMGFLLEQPSLPSPLMKVIEPLELMPFITDLQSSTWHGSDAQALMWLGVRPWSWYALGVVGLIIGLWLVNWAVVALYKVVSRKAPDLMSKEVKLN